MVNYKKGELATTCIKLKTKSADGHIKKTQDRAIKALCPIDVI